jgi:malonate transporter and related proteins
MTALVFDKLLAIFIAVALGFIAGRLRWLGPREGGGDPARVLSDAAFSIFVPALLFRTTARLDFAAMPWAAVAAYFVPVLGVLLAVYGWQRRQRVRNGLPVAGPSVRAIGVSFGNTVQIGIPLAAALFGETGLGLHIALVSLHALVLLTVLTALVELDLARAHAAHDSTQPFARTLWQTVRNTVVHPVVLPVLAGMAWNFSGWPLPTVVDGVLQMLGAAVVPLCLVLIGLSLATYGLPRKVGGALAVAALKLLLLPAAVLVVAHWGFGLGGLPLSVVVFMAALPVGSNALIFSQRYATLEAEATAAIVVSTLAFLFTAPLWLWAAARLG